METLRARQMRTVLSRMKAVNRGGLPVVIGGDLNSWDSGRTCKPCSVLGSAGYKNAEAAPTRINVRYPTVNHFTRTLRPGRARMDMLWVKGLRKAVRWENVMRVKDGARPSDHNMVVADVRLAGSPPA